ncbi:MAG: hypothetical protein ACK5LN_10810 [Propioniciclava sp.]
MRYTTLTLLCADASAATDSQHPITIATIPLSDDPTAENPVDVFGDLLAEQTGREVEVTDVPDYLSVVEAIRATAAVDRSPNSSRPRWMWTG